MSFESDNADALALLAEPPGRPPLNHEILAAALGDYLPSDQVETALELIVQGGGKFPSRVGGLPAGVVKAVQRERIVVGMLMAAAELGYQETTVRHVLERAGVSRPTFYVHFSDKDDCFLAAFDTGAARLRRKLEAAALRGGSNWRTSLRLGLQALLKFVGAEPETAKTLIVEARAASSDAMTRRAELLDRVAACIDSKARQGLPDASRSPLAASGIVGGIETVLYSRLRRGELDNLEELMPALMFFVESYEDNAVAPEGPSVPRLRIARTDSVYRR